MQISVRKITGLDELREACAATINKESKMDLEKIYKCMHSPIRSQLFMVHMIDIPTFVSVHLVRHKIGVEHWVKSNREDRPGYTGDGGRNHPVSHTMLINAESLINMARKRLCFQAHIETVNVMNAIKDEVFKVDFPLYTYLVPECHYRNGYCPELRPCGKYKVVTSLTVPEITRAHPAWVEL